MTFTSKLRSLATIFDETSEINIEQLEKSLVYWYGGNGYSYAIDGSNVLDLGPYPPTDMSSDTSGKEHAQYALIVRRSDKYQDSISVELSSKDDTLVDMQSKAIELAENNKNTVSSVSVCKYTGKVFAGRPVYAVESKYVHMAKNDIVKGVHVTDAESIFESLEKAGTQAQSIIFPKDKYTVAQAQSWLSSHGKKHDKVDSPADYHRFRQFDPGLCSTTPKTIALGGSGIKAVICVKKSEDIANMDTDAIIIHGLDKISAEDIEKAAMSTAEINNLPDSAFAYIEPGGTKDKEGKTIPRSKRHFPVHDKAHALNALQRAPQSPFGSKAMPKILAACHKFGIKVSKSSDDGSYELEEIMEIVQVEKQIKLRKYLKKGLVYGIVYEPDEVDAHGHYTSSEEIENACHAFLPSALKNGTNGWTDKNHEEEIEQEVEVVESYVAPCDFTVDGEKVKKGSWILVSHVTDPALLDSIEKGETAGYSLFGTANVI